MKKTLWIWALVAGSLCLGLPTGASAEEKSDHGSREPVRIVDSSRPLKAGPMQVTEVIANSPAAAMGIKTGDTLLALDGYEVQSATEISKRVREKIDVGTAKYVLLTFERGGQVQTAAFSAKAVRDNQGILGLRLAGVGSSTPRPEVPPADPSRIPAPLPLRPSPGRVEVTVHSSASCKWCKPLKEALKQRGIEFREVENGSPSGYPYTRIEIKGQNGELLFQASALGYRPDQISTLLERARRFGAEPRDSK